MLYTVNVQREQCTYPQEEGRKFCKHLCAINTGVNLLHAPDLVFQDRELATLSLGTKIIFYGNEGIGKYQFSK